MNQNASQVQASFKEDSVRNNSAMLLVQESLSDVDEFNNGANLLTQNHILDLRQNREDNNAIAKFVLKQKDVEEEKKEAIVLKKTTGTYFSFWVRLWYNVLSPVVSIECIAGTGAYPQESLYPQQGPVVAFRSSIEDKEKWLNDRKLEQIHRVIVPNNQITDRTQPMPIEEALELAQRHGIVFNSKTHMYGKIVAGDIDKAKKATLHKAFNGVTSSTQELAEIITKSPEDFNSSEPFTFNADQSKKFAELFKNMLKNKIDADDEVDVKDLSADFGKNGKAWIMGHFQIQMLLHDEIMKEIAVMEAAADQVVAVFK